MLIFADSGQGWSCLYNDSRAIMLSPWGAGGGLTNTASWRLWSKRSERNNRLLAVTAFPYKCESLVRRPMERGASGSL